MSGLLTRLALLVWAAGVVMVSLVVAARPAVPDALLLTTGTDGQGWLRLRDLERGRMINLLPALRGFFPSWSPDGDWIVYYGEVDETWGYYAFRLSGGEVQRTLPRADAYLPTMWSPDGRWLLTFEVTFNATFPIYYSEVTGEAIQRARQLDNGQANLLWSPDSRRLYYFDFLNVIGRITMDCLARHEPCIRERIAAPERRIDQLLGWMPDNRLMLVRGSNPFDGHAEVYTFDPDNGAMALLLDNPLLGTVPVWSPDGRTLAAALSPDDSDTLPVPTLRVVDAATGTRHLVWTGITGALTWSPDSTRLAFELIETPSQHYSVWIYQRDSGTVTRVTAPGEIETRPQWGRFAGRPFVIWPTLVISVVALGLMRVGLPQRGTQGSRISLQNHWEHGGRSPATPLPQADVHASPDVSD